MQVGFRNKPGDGMVGFARRRNCFGAHKGKAEECRALNARSDIWGRPGNGGGGVKINAHFS